MSDPITKPGIYQMPSEQYHRDPAPVASLSSSLAKMLLNRSPRHAWIAHPRLNPDYQDDRDPKFDIGTSAHAAFLEGKDVFVVVDADDWRTKAAKEARDAAHADGKTALLARQAEDVFSMVDVAREYIARTELADLLTNGKPEQTIIWRDGETWCRCRPDYWRHDYSVMLDYKTTTDASMAAFSRVIASMDYDFQVEFYSRGGHAAAMVWPDFYVLAQEVDPPYACQLYQMSDTWREVAESKVSLAMALWKRCLAENDWPAYPASTRIIEPPAWALRKAEMNGAQHGNK